MILINAQLSLFQNRLYDIPCFSDYNSTRGGLCTCLKEQIMSIINLLKFTGVHKTPKTSSDYQ